MTVNNNLIKSLKIDQKTPINIRIENELLDKIDDFVKALKKQGINTDRSKILKEGAKLIIDNYK